MLAPLRLVSLMLAFLAGCQTAPRIHTVSHVDLDRFMGSWFVVANIPTFIEKDAYNAIESYKRDKDGTIATTFTFREGSFTGPSRRYDPRGFVTDPSTNAEWDMQFIWPIKSDYRIVYLSDDYEATIIGRDERDYLWIMTRNPLITEDRLKQLIEIAAREGYDPQKIRRVPQKW